MDQDIITKRRIAFVLEYSEVKGDYPLERAIVLKELLSTEHVYMFLKSGASQQYELFAQHQIQPILFDKWRELPKFLKDLEIDLLIFDGIDSTVEQVTMLRPFCQALIHFDDQGAGAGLVDCHIAALFEESTEMRAPNLLAGSYAFAISQPLLVATQQDKQRSELPHIVIAYEDGDTENLTYRTLRHLTQLHIPLKISIVLDNNYKHPIEDLQMMVLSRKNTTIYRQPNALLSLLPTANIVICNANYTPYKVATIGIPCITAAQNERELNYSFFRESNGFVHLGLGRKMKQSAIQNAVMELLLHETRAERAIDLQQKHALISNNEILQALLLDFAYARHHTVMG